jgi:hypothetical protein
LLGDLARLDREGGAADGCVDRVDHMRVEPPAEGVAISE